MEKKPSRLLIVDDDAGTIRVLSRIVGDMGDIRFATDGEEAIKTIDDWSPDLVLLDAQMPGLSGFDVCRRVKADPARADLPILFVTSQTDVDSETMALEAGAVDFITKPLSPPIVKARVKTHLTLKHRTDELLALAALDGLTGIPNRRQFDRLLDQEWRRACRAEAPLSLLLIDVDHFKFFNDRYGHQAGDDCLIKVAHALAETARRPGEVVARYGGEEFVSVMPACDMDHATALGERMRAAVEALAIPHEQSPHGVVTVSIGAANLAFECALAEPSQHPGWGGPCNTQDECRAKATGLVALADRALYAAKEAGRNRVIAAEPD